LTRLLAGDAALPPAAPVALAPADRTPAEHDAVARALGCPDVFVLDAPDRPARERVVADLARSAAARGERVLVLSPDPAACDRLVELLATPGSRVVRALADDENPHRPSPVATRYTSAALGRGRVEAARRDAAHAAAGLEADHAALAAAAAAADELRALAERYAALEPDRAALDARLAGLDAEVRADAARESSPLAVMLDGLRADHDAAVAPLAADRTAVAACRAEATAARQHLVEIQTEGGKKTGFFSRLLHKPKTPADPTDLDRQLADLDREAKELADREAALQAEIDALAGRLAAEREKRIAADLAARRAGIDARLPALVAERDEIVGRYARRGKELDRVGVAAPALLSTEAAGRAAADVSARRADAEGRLVVARDRLDEVTRAAADQVRQLLAEARVVVGTPGSLAADPTFAADRDVADPPFALLVLDHAEELAEPDFTRLTRLAGRCVLAGAIGRPGGGASFAARLARLLDREPWAVEGDRLVCRLAHPTPDGRGASREPVADRPEIELRVADDGGRAVLAAIAFPAAMRVADAKAFLVAQLGETCLRPCGDHHWRHAADCSTAHWPAAECAAGGDWLDLESGVREWVVGAFTAAVAFDPAAGWDAASAEAWLAARLPADRGRVAALPRQAVPTAAAFRPVAVG